MAAILDHVSDENLELFREIFLTEDSDEEFLGFENDFDQEIEEIGLEAAEILIDGEWRQGNLVPSLEERFRFQKQKTIIPDVGNGEIIDFGRIFFTLQFFELLSNETNRYAADFLMSGPGQQLKPHSRFRKWTDTNADEMMKFIGMIICMGLVQHQDLQDYWSTDEVLQTPFFGKVMPRNRFLLLLSFLHLNDNSTQPNRGQPGFNPLHKIQPVVSHFQNVFEGSFYPGENLSLDEGMIGWRGNLSFRVYMPDKPERFGVKLFMLCDSSNGYCSRFEIYSGNDGVIPSAHGKIYDLVLRLMDPYLGVGHKLYVDNYYTSPALFSQLWSEKTGACGTLRSNRKGVPTDVKNIKLKKGEHVEMTNDQLQILKWKDKRDVLVLTTIHDASFENITGKNGEVVQRPQCVLDYNKYMGGVDRCDQMISYQAFKRRTLKWWKKVFLHLVMLATLNAYILYKEYCENQHKKHILQRTFRRELAKSFIRESGPCPKQRNIPVDPESSLRLSGRHFMSKIVAKEGAKCQNAMRTCVVCTEPTGKRKTPGDGRVTHRSRYECKDCNVGLCIEPCFMLYHENRDFKLGYKRWKVRQNATRDED